MIHEQANVIELLKQFIKETEDLKKDFEKTRRQLIIIKLAYPDMPPIDYDLTNVDVDKIVVNCNYDKFTLARTDAKVVTKKGLTTIEELPMSLSKSINPESMNQHKITLNLWQWACLIDFLRKMLESFTTWPLPDQYNGLERVIESIVLKYLIAHDAGLQDGTFSAITKGPALLLNKQLFEDDFKKTLEVNIDVSFQNLIRFESFMLGMVKALRNPPENLQDEQYEQAVKESLESILNQISPQNEALNL
jgi:hypothetical protein